MKKVIALVMCIAMIACVAVTASAADPVKATFTIDTVKDKKVGDQVIINVTIAEQKTMIGAIGFHFDYDTEYLKIVEEPESMEYFNTDKAANGALAVGNEETMDIQIAGDKGFKAVGTVLYMCFEVINEIPAGEIAEITGKIIVEPISVEDDPKVETDDVAYDVTIVNGGIMGKEVTGGGTVETKVDPPVVEPGDKETDSEIPATSDASAIAVAAGLCAVMAAAFVVTKKVND